MIDEDIPSSGSVSISFTAPEEKYKEANEAYKWNYDHWNALKSLASIYKLKSWKISAPPTISGDYFETKVETSLTVFTSPMTSKTKTSFSFVEEIIEGKNVPIIYFTNVGLDGLTSSGIYSNPNYEIEGVEPNTFPMNYLGTSL